MKTFLIPVDFSDVAYTAAQYAVDMATYLHASKLIFYHSYAHRPSDGYGEHATYEQATLRHLEKMTAKLYIPAALPKDQFVFIADDKPVKAGVEAIVAEHAVSLIVMGIAGLSDIENTLIGRNTMDVAKSGAAPLLIVPRNHVFKPIRKVVYATDLKDVEYITPAASIIRLAGQLGAETHIVHVDPATQGQTPEKILGKQQVLRMLEPLNPGFEVISEPKDKADGIFDYVKRHHIDLILMASRNHGFFEKLFHGSVSKKLLNIAEVPVVLLKNKPTG
ncbi:universal stress protein [Parapedobacter sp. ISTM3]|uniref:Nucleotide-binding universal stress protein, UspA family n=1 Tax=Parapedobacter luteus TaxID=623280 RepID=A0A1T5BRB0_9SPHI|nr:MULTISPECIES: universal stress protein [Parapedobacter]MBK1439340.1 universal stress protein [Parapedobacter sp. ISTM3]SKB49420.1 Nucleotide-binding universal stress protein, UspA family [Parapedobacter luteus]